MESASVLCTRDVLRIEPRRRVIVHVTPRHTTRRDLLFASRYASECIVFVAANISHVEVVVRAAGAPPESDLYDKLNALL